MFISIIIPTYNRLSILQKCLKALENQQYQLPISDYEVILVDDGSTDNTIEWLESHQVSFPHVRWFCQMHQGPAAARNLGIEQAKGDTIIFIDSDLVVTETFLQSHAETLNQAYKISEKVFTYGRVINTCNFNNPTAEPYKITDFSAAYFATGNVAIARHWLLDAGLFDTQFQLYGWEDLELGVRLKNIGLKLIKCPDAVGYHWHPPFAVDQLPQLIEKEMQRGRMGVLFYQKHPTFEVKMMIQMTLLHQLLWGILSLGGRLNEQTMVGFLQYLINRGHSQLALEVSRIFLNWYNVKAVYSAYKDIS
ncbi:MAG: glycosyltransferase [Microcoleaceae cyanobacterium]